MAAGAVLVATGYAWWATGRHPFTAVAYGAVALPVVIAVAASAAFPARRRGSAEHVVATRPQRATLPWILFLVGGLALEGLGLALGGRSTLVPTLSTTVDHAMRWHWSRFVLFEVWVAVGWGVFLHPLTGPGRSGRAG
ncbi:MAG: hypothetical protein ABSB09_16635 [Acidimicrobiales bacterium]|jgi:hypothetical protein